MNGRSVSIFGERIAWGKRRKELTQRSQRYRGTEDAENDEMRMRAKER
jgi:hypothetical protein